MGSSRPAAQVASNLLQEGCHSSQDRPIWSHFVNVTSHVVTLPFGGDDDPIMSKIISNGLSDTMIASSVLCLGASHMINHSSPGSAKVRNLTKRKKDLLKIAQEDLSTRVAALQRPRQITSTAKAEHNAILATYLLLYLYEMSEGTDQGSRQYALSQARSFVYNMSDKHINVGNSEIESKSKASETSCHNFEEVIVDESLLQFFLYHDILGRTLDDCEGINPDQRYDGIPLETLRLGIFHQGHISGIHDGLMDLILGVHILQCEKSATGTLGGELIARAVQIWQTVSDWSYQGSAIDLSYMYEAYIAAISIWLLFIMYAGDKRSEKIHGMVARGLVNLAQMDQSALRATSIFPFYFIGLGCSSQSDRQALMGELDRLENVQKLGFIREFRARIQKRWQENDEGSDEWSS